MEQDVFILFKSLIMFFSISTSHAYYSTIYKNNLEPAVADFKTKKTYAHFLSISDSVKYDAIVELLLEKAKKIKPPPELERDRDLILETYIEKQNYSYQSNVFSKAFLVSLLDPDIDDSFVNLFFNRATYGDLNSSLNLTCKALTSIYEYNANYRANHSLDDFTLETIADHIRYVLKDKRRVFISYCRTYNGSMSVIELLNGITPIVKVPIFNGKKLRPTFTNLLCPNKLKLISDLHTQDFYLKKYRNLTSYILKNDPDCNISLAIRYKRGLYRVRLIGPIPENIPRRYKVEKIELI